jgi:hypothetical protein
MNRRLFPSVSLTYISLVPHVWSTGPVSIRTPFSTSSARSPSTSSTSNRTTPPGDPVPRKRRNVQPRLVTHKPHIAGVRFPLINPVGEFPAEPQPLAVELFRRDGATYMQHGNGKLEQVAPPSHLFGLAYRVSVPKRTDLNQRLGHCKRASRMELPAIRRRLPAESSSASRTRRGPLLCLCTA